MRWPDGVRCLICWQQATVLRESFTVHQLRVSSSNSEYLFSSFNSLIVETRGRALPTAGQAGNCKFAQPFWDGSVLLLQSR